MAKFFAILASITLLILTTFLTVLFPPGRMANYQYLVGFIIITLSVLPFACVFWGKDRKVWLYAPLIGLAGTMGAWIVHGLAGR